MNIVRAGDRYGIKSPSYSQLLVDCGRAIPGMAFDKQKSAWVGSFDAVYACAELLKKRGTDVAFPARISHSPTIEAPLLRAYQREAVAFLVRHASSGVILGDDMGLGKTATAIYAAKHIGGKVLIVTPSYVRGVWHNSGDGGEIRKWCPELGTVYLPSGVTTVSPIPPSTDAVVIHYDILHAWADELIRWAPNVAILDECHILQSERALRSVACKRILSGCTYRMGLTGTPLTNRPKDLWNVLDTLSPGRFGEFFKFALRYCGAEKVSVTPTKVVWKFDGRSNEEELRTRLSSLMLRRTKSDVALELPPKTRQIIYVESGTAPAMSVVNSAQLQRSLDVSADKKLPHVQDLLSSHLDAGHKVVCFTYRKVIAETLVDNLRSECYTAELVHGSIAAYNRGAAIGRMKCAVGAAILVATIDSAGTGIDLSFADVCLFAELSYEPHKLLQAESRVHRFGQQSPTLVQYILSRGTVDEIIASKVVGKLDTFDAVVGESDDTLRDDLAGGDEDLMSEIYASIARMG